MNGWISIGEPDVPRLSPDAVKVFSIIQYADKLKLGIVRMKTRFGDDRIIEAIYEIRKMEAIRMGKLTNQQRAAIYQAWKDGTTQKELAKQYGVCAQAISQLCAKLAKAEQEIMQPASEEKPKPGIINPEFDAAVNAMIAENKSANAEERHSDTDSDIEKDTLDTKSDTIEPLPDAVYKALLAKLNDIQFDIEEREQRIAELTEEIRQLKHDRDEIIDWKDKYEH